MLKVNRTVVMNKRLIPPIKIISAIFSNIMLIASFLRRERNESKQLAIKANTARVVTSSMMVFFEIFRSFKDVSSRKQMPNRFEDAFRMCGDLELSLYILQDLSS
jgi:hypothetical protein